MSGPLFYPFQRSWITNPNRFKIGMFARQTGKTFGTTFEIANDCQMADLELRKARWVILSRGERQAREAMVEGVQKHAKALGAIVNVRETEYKSEATYRALECEWPNGSRVTALPANPDTARGFSANVFLDEFAFHKDSTKIWGAVFPVISNGWKIRVVSTPNGKDNKFYALMTGKDDLWYRQTTDIYQAVEDGLPRDVEALRQALNDDDLWAQEYELKWLDEASAWLSFDLINSCEDENAGRPELYQGGPAYVGVDIGIRNDLFVIWVDELVGDVSWTREIIARQRIKFAEQDMLLDDVFDRYDVKRLCMDQTGMGEKPVEDAKTRYGETRVEGVIFSGANKLTMATQGKEKFQDRKKRIPMGDQKLRSDLHKLKKVTSATGAPRFVAESDTAGHADRTWACFLADNAGGEPVGEVAYKTTTKRRFATRGAW
nr:terminase family protein [uncultured Desulfobacter sp.]